MTVDGSEHLKAKVVDHLDAVYYFNVVCKLVIHYSSVLHNVFEIDVVLVSLLLI